ncbi:winged helix family transcriptional regulator [Hanstruepera neustonica]|uniref:Winged helix family transcriptional regulator n=1 Tax=Hanstruepera neustonica TaxID=1445657 RepID=A0A2K1DYH6_9FLAO|nr:winged helix-turn-helix domain-containing protein [Hanstruepera neustonica]PNQ73077.1 winged helix family transcriptional regulator [Hanstruepera neustonica]
MNKKVIYSTVGLLLAIISVINLLRPESHTDNFPEKVKIALRDAGNQLLLANQDSTSRILPIKELEPLKYELSFERPLKIEPDSLVSILDNSLKKTELPNEYLTEVLQCIDNEVAYSFDMKKSVDTDVIPCRGRDLPSNCYTITVLFTAAQMAESNSYLWYLLLVLGFILIAFGFFNNKTTTIKGQSTGEHLELGSFYFYPEQNKLVKQATEINLSKKECEILALFVERPNQIIKRDELTKTVWEDNGVFVGRSLDTYISKLRKKLKSDKSIKLTNVHGVGYKLEVNQ